MIYLQITDRTADVEMYLEGTYSVRDLIDLIAEYADGESDSTEESDEESEEESEEEIEEGNLGKFVKLGC